MLNDQKFKLCNNLEVSNRTNRADTRTVQDGTKTSRSQEIDAPDDRKSLNVELAHDRTGQPVVERKQKMCQMVSKHVLVIKA